MLKELIFFIILLPTYFLKLRYNKNEKKIKFGGQKISALGERLAWFKDYLPALIDEEAPGIK